MFAYKWFKLIKMKRICLFVTALTIASLSFAQSTSPVQLGIKGGVNLANLDDKMYDETETRVGWHLGALAHIHLSPNFALQPEVMYSTQGAKYSGGTASIDYINVPVLAQYMFKNGFRLQTGPQVGFNISQKSEFNNGTVTSFEDDVRATDVSWAFGGGYMAPSGLGVDARYNLGIRNIRKHEQSLPYEAFHRVAQIGLFYQFRK